MTMQAEGREGIHAVCSAKFIGAGSRWTAGIRLAEETPAELPGRSDRMVAGGGGLEKL